MKTTEKERKQERDEREGKHETHRSEARKVTMETHKACREAWIGRETECPS